jgi:hypothetical protein
MESKSDVSSVLFKLLTDINNDKAAGRDSTESYQTFFTDFMKAYGSTTLKRPEIGEKPPRSVPEASSVINTMMSNLFGHSQIREIPEETQKSEEPIPGKLPTFKFPEAKQNAEALSVRLTEIVTAAISDATYRETFVKTFVSVVALRQSNVFNGFPSVTNARIVLTFLFPHLSSSSMEKLTVLLQAPLL